MEVEMNKSTERKLMEASLVLAFWCLVIALGAVHRVQQQQDQIHRMMGIR
jgi:hypothetical protein